MRWTVFFLLDSTKQSISTLLAIFPIYRVYSNVRSSIDISFNIDLYATQPPTSSACGGRWSIYWQRSHYQPEGACIIGSFIPPARALPQHTQTKLIYNCFRIVHLLFFHICGTCVVHIWCVFLCRVITGAGSFAFLYQTQLNTPDPSPKYSPHRPAVNRRAAATHRHI